MLNSLEISRAWPDIWSDLNGLFKITPCIYSSASFKTNNMFFGISENNNEMEVISRDLRSLSRLIADEGNNKISRYATYVHIFMGRDVSDVTDFMVSLLCELHGVDDSIWPECLTKNMSDADFKFFFAKYLWFPVLLTKDHPSILRRFTYTIIAFQPDIVFEFNKNNNPMVYEKIRLATHKKINSILGGLRPDYLTEKSIGKNIVQFIGYDRELIEDGYVFPFICNHQG